MAATIPRSTAKTGWGLCRDVIRVIEADYRRADMWTYQELNPECGMVGCFRGWVRRLMGDRALGLGSAIDILGLDLNYHCVRGGSHYVFGGGDACETTTPRTKAHARAVINRIKRFMRVNEKALKARRLP